MAIGPIGSASSDASSSTASSATHAVTVSHTQAAGSNRVLVVGAAGFWSNRAVAQNSIAATYNGTAMTEVVTDVFGFGGTSSPFRASLFMLKEADLPADGAHNVVVTMTDAGGANTNERDLAVVCRHLEDVDQTTTTRDTSTDVNSTATTAPSVAVDSSSGDLAIDVLASYSGTPTDDATQLIGQEADATDATDCSMSYEAASGASVTASWTTTSQESVLVAASFIPATADSTAPTLSSPVDAATGPTTGSGSVDTDEGNGTLYFVVTTSATPPSAAQVKAGQNDGGTAAVDSGSQAVSGTGTQNISGGFTGLTAETAYFAHYMHEDAATNQSTVSSGDGFTTDAESASGALLLVNAIMGGM